jgi:ATP-dependent phosphofructokinase / diphosphate-dependent phosphofructokinase
MVLEVMGRHAGWIATHAGIAGVAAIDLASQGHWDMMAALQGAEVASAPISEAAGRLNTVPESLYQVAEVFFA